MQNRMNDLSGVFGGLYKILKAGIELQTNSLKNELRTSSVTEGIKDGIESVRKSTSNVNPLELGSYVLDRAQMFVQQNAIVLRSLVSDTRPLSTLPSTDDSEINVHVEAVPTKNSTPQPNPISLDDYNPDSYNNDECLRLELEELLVLAVSLARINAYLPQKDLALGLGVGAAAELTRRFVGYDNNSTSKTKSPFLTDANLERIVDTLCRMRGAALKLGQMLSIQDESLVSPQVQKIFERVRQAADFMPSMQMQKVLESELGPDWRALLAEFDEKPFAAASIGQVHRGLLHDGRVVAMKIQYPGVADSIEADINNLMALLKRFNLCPRGLFADRAIEVAKRELRQECDYLREASFSDKFTELLKDDPVFEVPPIIYELTTKAVLTHEFANGLFLDECIKLPQDVRNWLGEQLLRLCLKELFVYRVMQTDPNWSNFMFNPETGKIILLDFGASREYSKSFVDPYIRLIHAASIGDRDGIVRYSRNLGFLTGYESKVMIDAHVDAVGILGEAFATDAQFDFGTQSTTKRINRLIPVMLEHRLTAPPDESYSLHRKMSGCFLLCGKLKAKVNCYPLFDQIWSSYQFDDDAVSPSTAPADNDSSRSFYPNV